MIYMRKLYLLLTLSFVFLPAIVMAENNTGFIDTAIWFSASPDTVGESITISTLVNNQEKKAIYGIISFYDNDKSLSKKTVTIAPNSSKVVSIDWKVESGSHSIVAKFEDTREVDDKGKSIQIANSETKPHKFTVIANSSTNSNADSNSNPSSVSNDDKENSPAGNSIISKEDVGKTVDEAKKVTETTFGKIDDFRAETAVSLEKKAEESTKELEEIKLEHEKVKSEGKVAGAKTSKDDTTEKESFLKTPFAYLKMIFYKMAHYIFAQKFLFYGLIVLLIILFIRYIIRAPR